MINNLEPTNHGANSSYAPTEFAGLLERPDTLCVADRDIVDLAHCDPAFDASFLDAEAARSSALVAAKAKAKELAVPRSPLNQHFAEGGGPFSNSPIARCFARFLSAAAELVAAERDLFGCFGHDPAVDNWIRDAERAFSRTSAVLDELLALPAEGAAATRLQHVGSLFRFVMLSDDPVAVAGVRNAAAAVSRYHNHAGYGVGQRSNCMIMTGLQQLETYLAIDDGLLADDAAPRADLRENDAPVPAAA